MSSQRITLDNPVFTGNLRDYSRRSTYERRPIVVSPRQKQISDFLAPNPTIPKAVPPLQPVKHQPIQALPAPHTSTTHEFEQHTESKAEHSNAKRSSALLIAMATILFVGGITTAYIQLRTNKHVAAQVDKVTQSVSEDTSSQDSNSTTPPTETKPDNLSSYSVPPMQPKLLTIPELSVSARIRKLGVNAQNKLQTPNNIYDTGWYEESAKPGDAGGAILIDGHVSGPTHPGVFYGLKTLKPGDTIQLERGDGTKFTFKVIKLQYYDADKVDMAAAVTSAVPGKLGLNLITCTGKYVASASSYNQRLIVFAVAE